MQEDRTFQEKCSYKHVVVVLDDAHPTE